MNLFLNINNSNWKFERKTHALDKDGVQYVFYFDNGYGASVIKTQWSYGSKEDLWELAVLKDGNIDYDNAIMNGNVRGNLTDEDVNELLEIISSF